ncbi:MAG: methyl-accepting chemotaxis protein, partial [Burkholderiaceae bacterium]|nr:methyl-accepting chemotaxis protein [Burkholderiaceae bacterium]
FMSTYLTAEEARMADAFSQAQQAYVNQGLLPMLTALQAGDPERALDIYVNVVSTLYQPVVGENRRLVQLQIDVAEKEFQIAGEVDRFVGAMMIGGTVFALILGAFLALLITRSIVQPIRRAVVVAQTVASGDLSSQIQVQGKDETAELLLALKEMNDSLVNIVSQVRQASDSIATGSSQIATGNADLSQRTEEQASNLEETAASMEELTATVQQNAETARQASQIALSASAAATKGGEVVGQVVTTMQDITQSSQKIADIITVIDGIAFQTNILALNAAVEAARAGEQGRGFAVVAGEVRTLAQRSASAAKEIKDLITSSVERVQTGSELVGQAGDSVSDIVQQVKRVTDLIAEITAASQEQASGISQVGEAVQQLDQVTQQNAALVEESAAAADSLQQQAHKLTDLVGVFKLAAGGTRQRQEAPVEVRPVQQPKAVSKPKPAMAKPRVAPVLPVAAAASAAILPKPPKLSGADGGQWESF